ncbi:MAG: 4-alpha-glucanotransferase [Eubacteriales bacterium]|nr:4-alpha-glucanotransferase [Eubacteriales bacterium]
MNFQQARQIPVQFPSPDFSLHSQEKQEGREAGVLLPLYALPSAGGIGSLGQAAYAFVDFLAAAGFSLWQLLPLGPTTEENSPYASLSAYAASSNYIGLDLLVEADLLADQEYQELCRAASGQSAPDWVDYAWVQAARLPLLQEAFQKFQAGEARLDNLSVQAFEEFKDKAGSWLKDFALYMALRAKFSPLPLNAWPLSLREKDPLALEEFYRHHQAEVDLQCFLQFVFAQQWQDLRKYAQERGIKLVGDMPIYVSAEACELWSQPEAFALKEDLSIQTYGGCPPDPGGPGQFWPTPVYNWSYEAGQNYAWWKSRLAHELGRFDWVRLDHFRGLDSYWAIPAATKDPRDGAWQTGPGDLFLQAIQTEFAQIPVLAEDLGYLTDSVIQLRESFGLPGMKIMQYAFEPYGNSENLPHNVEENRFYYFGTHDNLTIEAWLQAASPESLNFAQDYLGLNPQEGYRQGIIRGLLASRARWVILQMQDLLGGGRETVTNGLPDQEAWRWRMPADQATPEVYQALAQQYRELNLRYARNPLKASVTP